MDWFANFCWLSLAQSLSYNSLSTAIYFLMIWAIMNMYRDMNQYLIDIFDKMSTWILIGFVRFLCGFYERKYITLLLTNTLLYYAVFTLYSVAPNLDFYWWCTQHFFWKSAFFLGLLVVQDLLLYFKFKNYWWCSCTWCLAGLAPLTIYFLQWHFLTPICINIT